WIIPEKRNRLTDKQKVELFLAQQGLCPNCGQRLEVKGHEEVDATDEHLVPLWKGGTNALSNRQLWCRPCTKPKTANEATERAKVNKTFKKFVGIKKSKSTMPGSRNSRFKRKMDGTVVRRD